jgi:hypothetical protein
LQSNLPRGACYAFFKQAQFERLLRYNFLQITRLAAEVFDFVSCGSPRCIASKPLLASFHEVLRPFVINAL